MAGDLSKWTPADIAPAEGDSVKFRRKGGWFVTKKVLIIAILVVVVLLCAAVLVTKLLTENQYKPADVEQPSYDTQNLPLVRLSKDIVPKHYMLKLKPYLDVAPMGGQPFTVSGEVNIQFVVTKPTSMFTIVYTGISLNYTNVYNNLNKSLKVKSDKFEKSLGLYTVEIEENFVPDLNYTVHLVFQNQITDEAKGFYRTKYFDRDSPRPRWMGVSQMEPIHARMMFPCFDEPQFRATFDISVHRLKNMSALANTQKKLTLDDQENIGWTWDTFETTPPIPTHKVSIVLGDLTVSKVFIDNITLSLWTRSDLFNSSLNVVEVTTKLLQFYISYFTSVQPIMKLDLVAVPHFTNDISGAWALVLYSESLLFEHSNKNQELKYGLEMGKKLAEQWLGNIVSVDWWTDLWIRDALTTYLSYLALQQVRPRQGVESSFIVDVLQQSLDYESYPASTDEILVSNDIIQIWSFPYPSLKGASLFYMMASITPTNSLQDGINNYLVKGAGKAKAVISNTLWESLSINADKEGVDTKTFVKKWLKRGYPVVDCRSNPQSGEIVIDQKPFYLQQAPSDYSVWDVPLRYIRAQSQLTKELAKRVWLKSGDPALRIVRQLNDSWILINPPPQGYYRVNYDMGNWRSLEDDLLNQTVALQDNVVAMLVDDSFQLAKAGRLSYFVPFNLTLKVATRSTLLPLQTIETHLKFLQPFFYKRTNHEALFKNLVWKLFLPHMQYSNASENLGFTDNSHTRNLSQAIAIKWLCQFDHPVCVSLANSTFRNGIINGSHSWLKSPLADIFLCTAIRLGSKQDLEVLLNKSSNRTIKANERLLLLRSLSCSSNSTFIVELLGSTVPLENAMKEKREFNDEEVAAIWHTVGKNLAITNKVFNFFLKNWNLIYKKYQSNNKVLDAIIKGATDNLIEEKHLYDIALLNDHFMQENNVPLKSLELAVNKLIVRTAWALSKLPQVKDVLEYLKV